MSESVLLPHHLLHPGVRSLLCDDMRPGMRSLLHHHVQQWLLHDQLQQRGLHDDLRERLLLQQLLLHGQCTGDLLRGRRRVVTECGSSREQERAARQQGYEGRQGGAGIDRFGSRQSLIATTDSRSRRPPARNKFRAGFFVRRVIRRGHPPVASRSPTRQPC